MKLNSISQKCFLLKIFFVQVIVGCSKYNQQMIQQPSTSQSPPHASITSSDETSNSADEAVCGIVLIHGLGMDREEMEVCEEKLSQQLGGGNVWIINSEAREKKTYDYSTEEQVEMVYQEIITKLEAEKKNIQFFPLFILGQSQGGDVAIRLLELYGDKLNLLGVIAHHAPLKGADVLTRGPWAVQKFRNNAAKGMRIIGTEPKRDLIVEAIQYKCLNYAGKGLDYIGQGHRVFPGARGILPDSPCIRSISRYLRNGTQTNAVPVMLIAGYQNDYGKLFSTAIKDYKERHESKKDIDDTVNQHIQEWNYATAELITGDKHGLHDHLISLKSQLCRGDSLEDLTHIGDDPYPIAMPGNPNVTGVVIKGIMHTDNLCPIDNSVEIEEKNESIWRPIRMVPVVCQFIKEKLSNAGIDLKKKK